MAGDIIGQPTVFTGISITSTPGSALTNTQTLAVLSIQGGSQLSLAPNSAMTAGSGSTIKADTVWVSNLSTGGFGVLGMSSTSSLVAPFVVQGSASSFTVVTWAQAVAGDQIFVTPGGTATVSSISSGLVCHSHCTLTGQVEFRLSNVSTLVQNQSTRTWVFTRIAPF